jgi:hypothetical protein
MEVSLFLDLNSNLTLDAGEPSDLKTVTNLLVGTSQTAVGVFSSPPAGSYLGVAVADPANLLVEENEGNNLGNTPLVVVFPDLTVTGLSFSALPFNNKFKVTLTATVANIGPASAGNSQVHFAYSTNNGVSFTNIGGPVNAGTIPAGGTQTAIKVWNNVTAGSYLIKVTADPNNLINESTETNNVSVFPISVGGSGKVADGSGESSSPVETPRSYALEQNYPNPFNPATTIRYDLPVAGVVTLKVFDLVGQEVAVLVREYQEAGRHAVRFEAGHLPSGVYFYRLQTERFIETKRMLLRK